MVSLLVACFDDFSGHCRSNDRDMVYSIQLPVGCYQNLFASNRTCSPADIRQKNPSHNQNDCPPCNLDVSFLCLKVRTKIIRLWLTSMASSSARFFSNATSVLGVLAVRPWWPSRPGDNVVYTLTQWTTDSFSMCATAGKTRTLTPASSGSSTTGYRTPWPRIPFQPCRAL